MLKNKQKLGTLLNLVLPKTNLSGINEVSCSSVPDSRHSLYEKHSAEDTLCNSSSTSGSQGQTINGRCTAPTSVSLLWYGLCEIACVRQIFYCWRTMVQVPLLNECEYSIHSGLVIKISSRKLEIAFENYWRHRITCFCTWKFQVFSFSHLRMGREL